MSLRDLLKRSDHIARSARYVRAAVRRVTRPREIRRYLSSHGSPRLHIGAGPRLLPGWLNTDINPRVPDVTFLDAARTFPFGDCTFDYVYSEHVIEHLPWADGLSMLRECRRVLRPDGRIRIATPDLAVLLSLWDVEADARRDRYVRWITDRFLPAAGISNACFVINHAFRAWGHQFVYDAETLERTMKLAGFFAIVRVGYGRSDDPELCGIESHAHGLDDPEMVEFETMIMEGSPRP